MSRLLLANLSSGMRTGGMVTTWPCPSTSRGRTRTTWWTRSESLSLPTMPRMPLLVISISVLIPGKKQLKHSVQNPQTAKSVTSFQLGLTPSLLPLRMTNKRISTNSLLSAAQSLRTWLHCWQPESIKTTHMNFHCAIGHSSKL